MTEHSSLQAGWRIENSYGQLPTIFYSKQHPMPVREPRLIVLNDALADQLGLDSHLLRSSEEMQVFAGNALPDGADPLAQAYAGHQFGTFTMLGDGRALLLGEQIMPDGQRVDIQLKGSGRTPYSRQGDGRAALGPMLREYIISEAMHALGIPTTRSLAVVTTGEEIVRESLLDGAILTRVASSHLRVGTFQYAASRCSLDELRTLADYTIQRHFPMCYEDYHPYLSLLKQVIARQARLIAQWQLVGFVHGVMNTDNMSICGETIDYGPCAFMDRYHTATVFSSIDVQGRYAYGNQPYIAAWNLTRFAECLLSLLHDNEDEAVKLAEEALASFVSQYESNWLKGMRAKLGLFSEEDDDNDLVQEFLDFIEQQGIDYTNAFRSLTTGQPEDGAHMDSGRFHQWRQRWISRLERDPASTEVRQARMRSHNPSVIPRNHRVEEALEAAVERGDYQVMNDLLEVLKKPYAYLEEHQKYTTLPASTDRPYRTYCGT